jgi:hypothetical protein
LPSGSPDRRNRLPEAQGGVNGRTNDGRNLDDTEARAAVRQIRHAVRIFITVDATYEQRTPPPTAAFAADIRLRPVGFVAFRVTFPKVLTMSGPVAVRPDVHVDWRGVAIVTAILAILLLSARLGGETARVSYALTDLGTLGGTSSARLGLRSDPRWVLTSANGINDVGEITGVGLLNGQPRAFLLSPR